MSDTRHRRTINRLKSRDDNSRSRECIVICPLPETAQAFAALETSAAYSITAGLVPNGCQGGQVIPARMELVEV
jgi:hypothetical protein